MPKSTDIPSTPLVTVAISTLGDRVSTISLPEPHKDLSYLILVQKPSKFERDFNRWDVTTIFLTSVGLSNSRNSALKLCQSPYLLFSDDDLNLDSNAILALSRKLSEAPSLAFVSGWRAGRNHLPAAQTARWFNMGHICAPELLIRLEDVRASSIEFDTLFGVGATYPSGEDYIILCDMLAVGLKGRSFPIVTGNHDGLSTGDLWDNPEIISARRAVLIRCFGRYSRVILFLYAFRHRRQLGGLYKAWLFASHR